MIFSTEKIFKNQSLSFKENKKKLKKVFLKYIKIKRKYFVEAKKFVKKNNIGKNTLGVHWRGTDHKVLPNHPMPPTENQIINLTRDILQKKKFKNIFLVTEQKKYLKIFKDNFNNANFFKSFRSDKLKDFSEFDRKNHKYNLGKESLIETLILSKVPCLICSRSNISEMAELLSYKNKMKVYEINNGNNSPSILFSLYKWNIKKFLPKFFNGFS